MEDEKLNDLSNFMQNMLEKLAKVNSEEIEMEAIWLEKPIIYNHKLNRWTCRMVPGDQIRLENAVMVRPTLENEPTHQVIGVFGTINSSMLSATVISLDTLELEILKLK